MIITTGLDKMASCPTYRQDPREEDEDDYYHYTYG